MSDSQALAAKPPYLSASSHGKHSLRSSTAARETTSTLAPKAAATVSVSDASVSARLAALHAGARAQNQVLPSPVRRYDRKGGSPPRGRQLHSSSTLISGVASSTTSLNRSNQPSKPILQRRPSSTNAVMHSSPKSISPIDSPAQSPQRLKKLNSGTRKNDRGKEDITALFGAVASVAGITRIYTAPTKPVRTQVLDFEKMPKLSASERPQVSRDDIGLPTLSKGPQSQPSVAQNQLISRSPPDNSPREIKSLVSRAQTMPLDISREFPSENAAKLDGKLRTQPPPVLPRSTVPRRMQTNSPPKSLLRHREEYRSGMTVNSLADAMVASSLASSRATSPAKPPPPPSPRRRSRSVTAVHELKSNTDREISHKPALRASRPMKHTLRKHVSDDDEVVETKRGRRHWMRKHPNMHSEGDRKRWLDKVTERERKRYEGVFAANRGLLIGPGFFVPSPSALSDNTTVGNQVVNVVVRDIWERSRLPPDVLREIYELVCPEEALALNREQFVVGLWLIDQRLKGRKLPFKVSSSVWSSVRHTQGIKIRKMGS